MELTELLELLQARGVKRAVFDGDSLQEVEFFESLPTPKGEAATVEVELPVDDGVPMGVKNAADLLMAKKPAKGAA
jgi:hypothetical protein